MNGYGHRTALGLMVGLGVAGAVLTACGSDTGGPGASLMAPAAIATSSVSGLGTVLVDSAGKTLYFNDQDAMGGLRCTGSCLHFWVPATASGMSVPTGSVAGLSVIKRSDDGRDQFTYQGKPLYEFRLDAMAGQVNGQDAHDWFDGMSFAWRAAVVAGTAQASSAGIPGY